MSGAGGWIAFDRRLAKALSHAGIDVIGIDSRTYFLWRDRTPETTARFVEDLARSNLSRLRAWALVLIGYSQGADVMPFVLRRLSAEVREHVGLMVLIAPSPRADFTLRLRDVMLNTYSRRARPVVPEIIDSGFDTRDILCISGAGDRHGCGHALAKAGARHIVFECGHVFRRYEQEIASAILSSLANRCRGPNSDVSSSLT